MKRFQKGDRVFDIRYGWGIVGEGFTASTITVWFEDVKVNSSYDIRFAPKILSYTEYALDGHTTDRPELTWDSVWNEWYDMIGVDDFKNYLDENFEPPVRKCK